MTVVPAVLTEPPSGEAGGGGVAFVGLGGYLGSLEEAGYVEEEWFVAGEADGRPYTTTVVVRRPRDPAAFSGTLIVEPLHAMGATPVWMYTSKYVLRAGHAWAMVGSQKTALEQHVKSFDADRYASRNIEAEPAPEGTPPVDGSNPPMGDPAKMAAFFAEMQRRNSASSTILAQVGAALRGDGGPLAELDIRHAILVGHSQTGGVVTDYVLNAHDAQRTADGSPVFDGYFPSGAARHAWEPRDSALVQVLSEGDISDPNRAGREGRHYRRADSDEPGDRYRLYELAGVAHMGTRYPPHDDPAQRQQAPTAGRVPLDVVMNSLPHYELFSMALDHLVRWVADGVVPPRAERIEVGPDGWFAADEHGNSLGGVRCPEMDVPRARYFPNPRDDDGRPSFGVVGTEEAFDHATLAELYRDHDDYVARYSRRLDELISQGWLLPDDADEVRGEAEKADVP
jgi:hypothetical protein